jgi:hypothetical protein
MIKATTTTRILAAFMASSMFLSATACSSGPGTPEPTSSTAENYSGVDTFKGIFFNQGPAAAALAELRQGQASQAPASGEETIAALEHAIVQMKADGWSQALIDKAQAQLDTYRAGGHPPEATPEQTAFAAELVTARIAESDPTFFDRFGAEMRSGDHVRVEAAMADAIARVKTASSTLGDAQGGGYGVALIGAVIVVLVVVAAVYAWTKLWPDVGGQTGGRLGHAETIDRLTNRFAQ